MLTDWAVSNTTLEEVFIQLARKEHEQESGNASSNSEEVVNMQIMFRLKRLSGKR